MEIKLSKKHKKNISEGLKKYYSDNPVWNKGIKFSEETKKKLRGRIPWNKGRKGIMPKRVWSNEVKEKIRKTQLGERNSNWKGGTSSETKRIKGSSEWKNWRIRIFTRDNFICRECGSKKKIEPHHIKEFSIYIELRFDVNNGLTLCNECHKQTDNYGSRQLRKRGELLESPERIISSQAEKSEGSTVRGEIILTSAPHSKE